MIKQTVKAKDQEVQKCIDDMTLARNTHFLSDIFNRYKIGEYLDHFGQWNDNLYVDRYANVQSYHNKNHCISVALNCYEGVMSAAYFKTEDRIALLLAGLFHDVQHGQGSSISSDGKDDRVNVNQALFSFDDAHKDVEHKVNTEIYKKVNYLIKSTEYPYIVQNSKLVSDTAKIIRDADFMNVYEFDEIAVKQLMGLYNENCVNRSLKYNRELTPEEFIENNSLFLQKMKWNTQWARLKAFKLNYPSRVKLICDLFIKQAKKEEYTKFLF